MTRINRFLLTILICSEMLLVCSAHGASSEFNTRTPLTAGMSMGEVLRVWGEPTEKTEHETRRLVVWQYPVGKVIFTEGRLSMFPSSQVPPATVEVKVPRLKVRALAPQPPGSSDEVVLNDGRDIISEVLRDVPSDDDPGVGKSPGSTPSGSVPGVARPLPPRRQPMPINDEPPEDL